MATSKLPNLGFKQVGQNLNVTVESGDDVKVITLKGSKEVLAPVKELLKQYEVKKSPKLHKEIMALLTPKTTKEAIQKDKEVIETKAKIKLNKNKAKAIPKDKKGAEKVESVDDLLSKIENMSADDIDRLEAAIRKTKPQPKPTESTYRRRGEH